jgi:hypothetical protein
MFIDIGGDQYSASIAQVVKNDVESFYQGNLAKFVILTVHTNLDYGPERFLDLVVPENAVSEHCLDIVAE